MTSPYRNDMEAAGGYGSFLGGLLRHFGDPDKKKREQLLAALSDPKMAEQLRQQVAADPNTLDGLLGKKGFLSHSYDKDAAIAKALLTPSAGDQTRILEDRMKNVALQGIANTQFLNDPNIANASARVPSANLSNIKTQADLQKALSPEAQAAYDEFQAKATGTLNKKDSDLLKAQTDSSNTQAGQNRAETDRTIQATKLEGEKAQRDKDNRLLATRALARIKSDNDLYEAFHGKKTELFSPDEKAAIMADPETKARFDKAQSDHWEQVRTQIQRDNNKNNLEQTEQHYKFATISQIVEKHPELGWEDAKLFVDKPSLVTEYEDKNPEDIPKDPQSQRLYKAAIAMKEIRDKNTKPMLASAIKELYNSETWKRITKSADANGGQGGELRANDLDLLNQESAAIFAARGLEPIIYGPKKIGSTFFGGSINGPEIISADPKLIKYGLVPKPKKKEEKKGFDNTLTNSNNEDNAIDIIPGFDIAQGVAIAGTYADSDVLQALQKQFPSASKNQLANTLAEINRRRKK